MAGVDDLHDKWALNESLHHKVECLWLVLRGRETGRLGRDAGVHPAACPPASLPPSRLLPFLPPIFAELLLCAGPCAGSQTTGMKLT